MTPQQERVLHWCEALESGEYPQGTGYLRRDEYWCCMGVACDVAIKDGLSLAVGAPQTEWDKGVYDYGGRRSALPDSVVQWYGLWDDNPVYDGACLADRNDSMGQKFNQIAALLRSAHGLPPREVESATLQEPQAQVQYGG